MLDRCSLEPLNLTVLFFRALVLFVSHRPTSQISIKKLDYWEFREKLQRVNIASSVITGWDEWDSIHLGNLLKIYSQNVLFLE